MSLQVNQLVLAVEAVAGDGGGLFASQLNFKPLSPTSMYN